MRTAWNCVTRALPTLLHVGVAETVAYRASLLVSILTSTAPLVMLGLWTSVADETPFAQYSSADFVAYFLGALIVRNLTDTWVTEQLAEEIRTGQLSMRLLRPIHPFITFVASSVAALPFRSLIALPVALILLQSSGASALASEPIQLLALLPSVMLAWLITFAVMFALGSCGFWTTRTSGLFNLYSMLWALFSGYLIPMSIIERSSFSPIADVAAWLPFYYMLGAPVDLMMKHLTAAQIAELLGAQAGWGAVSVALALWAWRAGMRRFEAVGA